MEVLFILGIITILSMQYLSKALNGASKSGRVKTIVVRQPIEELANEPQQLDFYEDESAEIESTQKPMIEEGLRVTNDEIISDDSSIKDKTSEKNINISFKNISEAKRAFIYSEIFNRKY